MSLFMTRTDAVVRGALDGLVARHRTFVNNLANLETPGFQPSDVPFEAQLRQARDGMTRRPETVARGTRLALGSVPNTQEAQRADGNGVQADQQVLRLAENTMTYESLTQAAKMRGELLRAVIMDGRR